jgi:hypothetical protein
MPAAILLKHDLCPDVLSLHPGCKEKNRRRHFCVSFIFSCVIFVDVTTTVIVGCDAV